MSENTQTPDKFCFILRGLPGSGKDLLTKFLTSLLNLSDEKDLVAVINTDQFFVRDGKYHFDKLLLKEAHEQSWLQFRAEVDAGRKVIIVNNSNIKAYHYWHYLDYATRSGYLVSVTVLPSNHHSDIELANRNTHKVDTFTIGKMRADFEWEIKKP